MRPVNEREPEGRSGSLGREQDRTHIADNLDTNFATCWPELRFGPAFFVSRKLNVVHVDDIL